MENKQLIKKLTEVMQQVKYIEKRGFNSFHGYKYATEADVNEKVREYLAEKNILFVPNLKNHSIREHTTSRGNKEYITCVDMEFTFIDGDTGETLTFNISGEGQDSGDKGIYKAISGAQKYALMKVFMIPTGDDPERDNETAEETEDKPERENKTEESFYTRDKKQFNSFNRKYRALLNELYDGDRNKAKKHHDKIKAQIGSLKTWTPEQFKEQIEELTKMIKTKEQIEKDG